MMPPMAKPSSAAAVLLLLHAIASIGTSTRFPVADRPAMGFNTWNTFACTVNDNILRAQALALHDSGLQAALYVFINSDDCWMSGSRDAVGNLVPDPARFPNITDTIAFIHSLGLKAGLYTARGTHTCDGFAGACDHEGQDALWYASKSIDYLKDDDCSACGSDSWADSYGKMQQGLWDAGRPIVLSVEGTPRNAALYSKGGYGNSLRVGHDITPRWANAISLVDMGSGWWKYAHNSSNASIGGWHTDLDMLEVGRGEFSGPGSLELARAHFSLWCIMKAPLLLGNDLTTIDATTLSIVTNADAISANQDPLGVQGRRTSVYMPANSTINTLTGHDAVAVVAPCNASSSTQRWSFASARSPSRNLLFLVPCNASDAYQRWDFAGATGGAASLIVNGGSGQCIDAAGQQWDPSVTQPCNATAPSQLWQLSAASAHITPASPPATCLDLYNFVGPDVDIYTCKAPGAADSNQQWAYNGTTKALTSLVTGGAGVGMCVSATNGGALPGVWAITPFKQTTHTSSPATANAYASSSAVASALAGNAALAAVADEDQQYCLSIIDGVEAGWTATPCNYTSKGTMFVPSLVGPPPPHGGGIANYTLGNVGYNNEPDSSGPWPHSRYIVSGSPVWSIDLSKADSGEGTLIQVADTSIVIDDDLVGGISLGGAFCLDIRTMGVLEVWTSPLANGAFAAVLFNRSPGDDSITLKWSDLSAWGGNVLPTDRFDVKDVWAGVDRGAFSAQYVAPVPAHGVVMLILRPAA